MASRQWDGTTRKTTLLDMIAGKELPDRESTRLVDGAVVGCVCRETAAGRRRNELLRSGEGRKEAFHGL